MQKRGRFLRSGMKGLAGKEGVGGLTAAFRWFAAGWIRGLPPMPPALRTSWMGHLQTWNGLG